MKILKNLMMSLLMLVVCSALGSSTAQAGFMDKLNNAAQTINNKVKTPQLNKLK
ncbi:MAG: hypothetical protein KBD53_08665 [Candidatus Omnitrophica bacterium]|nr:hypothetical protein [Candidatus Omnitrophota bacterium]